MHTACGSALTPALNVDGLNLTQSRAAKALGLSVPPSLLDFLLMQFRIFCLGNKKRHELWQASGLECVRAPNACTIRVWP
jgi:hypothetical protein